MVFSWTGVRKERYFTVPTALRPVSFGRGKEAIKGSCKQDSLLRILGVGRETSEKDLWKKYISQWVYRDPYLAEEFVSGLFSRDVISQLLDETEGEVIAIMPGNSCYDGWRELLSITQNPKIRVTG